MDKYSESAVSEQMESVRITRGWKPGMCDLGKINA